MAVEMIITIREVGNQTHIEIVGRKPDGATPNEMAHSFAIAEVVGEVAKEVSAGKLGCNCPACKANREKNNGRSNLH